MEKIQEILNKGLEDYEKKHKIINYKKKVINAIKDCKTGKNGKITIDKTTDGNTLVLGEP